MGSSTRTGSITRISGSSGRQSAPEPRTRNTIASWWALEDRTAFGLVALSGRVVEHETGYRAAEATALSVIGRVANAFATFSGEAAVASLFRNRRIAIERNDEWVSPSPGNPAHTIVATYLTEERRLVRALEHATWAGN